MRRARIAVLFSCLLMLAAGCTRRLDVDRQAALRALARWQDARYAPSDSLSALLASRDAHVRRAAARTAGLIGRPGLAEQLLPLLDDRSDAVRVAAAHALGFLGDPTGLEPLRRHVATAHPEVRRAILFALGRIPGGGEALADLATQLTGREAAVAWDGLRLRGAELPAARLRASIVAALADAPAASAWHVLNAARIAAPDSGLTAALLPWARSDDAECRVRALQALARPGHGRPGLEAVLAGASRLDRFSRRQRARIRIAACRAIGALAGERLDDDPALRDRIVACLGEGLRDREPHVRLAAARACARLIDGRYPPPGAAARASLLPPWRLRLLEAVTGLWRAGGDEPALRAAALRAAAALRGPGLAATPLWTAASADTSLQVRAAFWAAAFRHVDDLATARERWRREAAALPPPVLVEALSALPDLAARWRSRGSDAAADSATAWVASVLGAALLGDDSLAATVAADALGRAPDLARRLLPDLLTACDEAAGPWRCDLRLACLRALDGLLATAQDAVPDSLAPAMAALLQDAFDDSDVRLRLLARRAAVAHRLLPRTSIPDSVSLLLTLPQVARDSEQPAVRLPFDAPRVRCLTPRGEFVIALDGRIAPNTVAAFLDLVERGFYDGLTFHRVVPDFVVQGGDPTGTGWGGPGYTIRSEWSDRPYRRGTVGIAHDGKDTGGSQFFVALSDQPHLEGRYTVFGEVVKGLDVCERLLPGDHFVILIEQ